MDKYLEKEEKYQLISLLDVSPNAFTNIPLMRQAFKKACKKLHPDKGGDNAQMMLLNSLWQKYQDGVLEMRNDPQVCTTWMDIWDFSLQDCHTVSTLRDLMLKSPQCLSKGASSCNCIASKLIAQHDRYKLLLNKRCLVWGECFCIFCFALWYGLAPNWETFELWAAVVFSESYGTPFFRARYAAWASGVFTNEGSAAGPDLYCDESASDSEPEEPTNSEPSEPESSGYNSFSQGRPFSSSFASQEEASSSFCESQHSSSSSGRSRGAENESPQKGRRHGENVDGSCPSSQASFASTPPKEKAKNSDSPTDVPSCLFDFISHAVFSNKTVNSFLIYSTAEKTNLLYDKIEKLKIEFKSLHKTEHPCVPAGAGFLLIMTNTKHRLSAVKNFCFNFCTISFLVCKIVLKPLECYQFLCKAPFREVKSNKVLLPTDFDDSKEESCNWNTVADFAVDADLDDPLLILAHYLDFAVPAPCFKCNNIKTKAHEFHCAHHNNATLFQKCKNQRAICNQAADVVQAKRRLLLAESTRVELLTKCFEKQLKKLQKIDEMQIINYMGGVAWYACLFEEFDTVLFNILKLLTENVPKQRNILFRGPVNTGKTTLAAALMDLVEGKSLNVNCPADKINFELGCAIDRFAVCFEDVKGQTMKDKKLQPGQGINNLDNMRDYLDGAVPVNLERKHVNKRSQIFPPAVVTMNEYLLPETLFVRFHMKLNFVHKPNLQKALDKTPSLLTERVLQKGLTLFMLLMWYFSNDKFHMSLRQEISTWKTIVEKTVNHEMFCKMLENVEAGDSPLHNIIEEEDV
ncbi:large T antigen [Scotophilus kuhlii polyomavirus 3]|nr:large T antigen [Scotophilus kuhlii polyomavirus 3]